MACDSGDCVCGKKEAVQPNATHKQEEDDDVWASDNDESSFIPQTTEHYGESDGIPSHVESLALQRKHAKQGYLDGLGNAKEESLQQGFDEGYPLGATLGVKVGQILIQVQHLFNESKCTKELYDEALSEVTIQKILHLSYFDDNLRLKTSDHPVIAKWDNIIKGMRSQ